MHKQERLRQTHYLLVKRQMLGQLLHSRTRAHSSMTKSNSLITEKSGCANPQLHPRLGVTLRG